MSELPPIFEKLRSFETLHYHATGGNNFERPNNGLNELRSFGEEAANLLAPTFKPNLFEDERKRLAQVRKRSVSRLEQNEKLNLLFPFLTSSQNTDFQFLQEHGSEGSHPVDTQALEALRQDLRLALQSAERIAALVLERCNPSFEEVDHVNQHQRSQEAAQQRYENPQSEEEAISRANLDSRRPVADPASGPRLQIAIAAFSVISIALIASYFRSDPSTQLPGPTPPAPPVVPSPPPKKLAVHAMAIGRSMNDQGNVTDSVIPYADEPLSALYAKAIYTAHDSRGTIQLKLKAPGWEAACAAVPVQVPEGHLSCSWDEKLPLGFYSIEVLLNGRGVDDRRFYVRQAKTPIQPPTPPSEPTYPRVDVPLPRPRPQPERPMVIAPHPDVQPPSHSVSLRDRLQANSLKLVVNDFFAHPSASYVGEPSTISFTLENQSGIGVAVALNDRSISAGPCAVRGWNPEVTGISSTQMNMGITNPQKTWLASGARLSGTIALGSPDCHAGMFRGLNTVPVSMSFLVEANNERLTLPLTSQPVRVRGTQARYQDNSSTEQSSAYTTETPNAIIAPDYYIGPGGRFPGR